MTVEQWTRDKLIGYVFDKYGADDGANAMGMIDRWLRRGDGAAVYENHDLGHPDIGHCQIVSFGSGSATLEPYCGVCRGKLVFPAEGDTRGRQPTHANEIINHDVELITDPPTTLPDFPNRINWRYQLVATCREKP